MKTVGRSILVDAMAEKLFISKANANEAIGCLLDTIETNLAKGNKVKIVGFGSFEARKRAARIGRNPATGETLKIKACVIPAFKAGAGLKAAVLKAKK